MLKYIIILLVLPIVASSCIDLLGESVKGDGNVTTQNRNVAGFGGVLSSGSFDIYVSQGAANSVKVEADANLMPYIKTEVRGNDLKLYVEDGFSIRPSEEIKVYITAPSYNKIKLSGSGNVIGEGEITSSGDLDLGISGSGDINVKVNAQAVSANISGSGKITVAGEAGRLKGSIAGSGDVHAEDMQSREAAIHIAGSGSAYVNASEKLSAEIAGSGGVSYKGNPSITSHVAGSGSLNKID